LHVPTGGAQSDSAIEVTKFDIPWWNDPERYAIGRLTKKLRKVTVINTLTKDE
jgi:hypothetical protein